MQSGKQMHESPEHDALIFRPGSKRFSSFSARDSLEKKKREKKKREEKGTSRLGNSLAEEKALVKCGSLWLPLCRNVDQLRTFPVFQELFRNVDS